MTEVAAPIGVDGLAPSAGAMLRAAREQRGLHIAALAAAMKVPQRKLEALEADRYDALPDLTFTRALAQSVCRALKIDAQPVLDRLPNAGDRPRLARVGAGLNTPFRERPGRDEPTEWSWLRRPVFWIALVVLAAAVALALLPDHWLGLSGATTPAGAMTAVPRTTPGTTTTTLGPSAVATAASAALAMPAAPASAAVPVSEPVPTVPALAPTPSAEPRPAATSGLLTLRTRAASWVEVQDANGQTLLSRHLQEGESVGLDGALPLRLTIGNASATQVLFRGQAVDLSPNTRDNVARMQLN